MSLDAVSLTLRAQYRIRYESPIMSRDCWSLGKSRQVSLIGED